MLLRDRVIAVVGWSAPSTATLWKAAPRRQGGVLAKRPRACRIRLSPHP